MIGMRHILSIDVGKKLKKLFVLVLITVVLLCGCAMGRGDRYIDLIEGYGIDVVSSKEILVVYKSPEMVGNEIVIREYYVSAYQIRETTIFLKGIAISGDSISDDDLENCSYTYYLIDSVSHSIIGPFEASTELEAYCLSHEISYTADWVPTRKQ